MLIKIGDVANEFGISHLKQNHPDILCWMVFLTTGDDNRYCYHDCEMKKQQFLEDNGFRFYTNADIYFAEALIYATGMERSRFYSSYMGDCDFRYTNLERSKFTSVNFKDCELENCNLTGMTIDGINVAEALEYYKNRLSGTQRNQS